MPPKKKNDSKSSFLAYPPYGQQAFNKKKSHPFEYLKEENQWPSWLPSFELYCALTNYDPTAKDGGVAFQRTMHYLLVTGNQTNDVIDYINKTDFSYYKNNQLVNEVKSNLNERYVYNKDDIAHCSESCARVDEEGWGGGTDFVSGTARALVPRIESAEPNEVRNAHFTARTFRPGSKWQWYTGAGLSAVLGSGRATESNVVQHNAKGRTGNSMAGDLSGVPSGGNRTAAFFGLYYYPDCENKKYNWLVGVKVQNNDFCVRMRLPNPNYELKNNNMYVQEPLNKPAADAQGVSIVNPEDGVPVPHVQYEMQQADVCGHWVSEMSTNPQSGKKNETDVNKFQARLAPWFGGNPESGLAVRDVYLGTGKSLTNRIANERLARLLPNIYAPTDDNGLLLGFRVPKAVWLYPHYRGTGQTVTHGVSKCTPMTDPYQPVPEWRDGVDPNDVERFDAQIREAMTKDNLGFAYLLKLPVVNEKEEQMLYALGIKKNPRRVKHVRELLGADVPASDRGRGGGRGRGRGRGKSPIVREEKTITSLQQTSSDVPSSSTDPIIGPAPLGEAQTMREAPEGVQGEDADDIQQMQQVLAAETAQADAEVGPTMLSEGVNNSVAENAVFSGETDNDFYAEEHLLNPLQQHPFEELRKARLPAGSARRPGDKNLNEHWQSPLLQPWPTEHLYQPNHAHFNLQPMNEKEIERYHERYGNVANLLVQSMNVPKLIDGVDVRIGWPLTCPGNRRKKLYELELTAYQANHPQRKLLDGEPEFEGEVVGEQLAERFRRSMVQIVRTYFDTSGQLPGKVNKAEGMLKGLYAHVDHGTPTFDGKTGRRQTPYRPPEYKKGKGLVQVLPPVFLSKPNDKLGKRFYDKQGSLKRQLVDVTAEVLPERLAEYYEPDVSWVKSHMTVLEWLQTPWHYHYLPYQPQSANFRDGETFCLGCARCARPFFEHQHRYESYWHTLKQTTSWPQKYWRTDDSGSNEAPVPFHMDAFFELSRPDVVSKKATIVTVPLAAESDKEAGYHNWKTYAFLLQSRLPHEYQALQLRLEADRRLNAGRPKLGHISNAVRARRKFTYRQTINELWLENQSYPTLVQGRVTRANAYVRFGMINYMLSRSTKYGNVCKDCASVLQFAPGLYEQNTQTVATQGILADWRHKQNNYAWWSDLAALKVRWTYGNRTYSEDFDTDLIKTTKFKRLTSAEDRARFAAHMQAVREHYSSKHCPPKQDASNAEAIVTKLNGPVDIWIQKRWERNSDAWPEIEQQEIQGISALLDELKAVLQHNYQVKQRNGPAADYWPIVVNKHRFISHNRALYDVLHSTHANFASRDAFRQGKPVSRFDPDMVRTELRNERRNGYSNVLVTRVWQPTRTERRQVLDDAGQPVLGPDGQPTYHSNPRLSTDESQYKEEVFYATRRGEDGKNGDYPGQWRGDGYVTQHDPKTDGWIPLPDNSNRRMAELKQVRSLKQTRLFMTYSFHRAVTSELEARNVMERMADAFRAIFGTDQHLCEMLVFGKKLAGLDTVAGTDTISSAHFVPIERPRKENALFYGGVGGSSYLYDTYDTHVDSVDCDIGVEIGPNLHHPHAHILLTVNHWSYVQFDWYRFKAVCEAMFKGLRYHAYDFTHGKFKLLDAGGLPFYTDSENPYFHMKLYPTDNWQDVVAAYVRKNTNPSVFESLKRRTGMTGQRN